MYRVSLLITCCALASAADKILPVFPTGDIANGQDAKPHSAPYIVSLRTTSHFCAGSIISESIIVTAAHCLENFKYTVVAGLHDRRDETGAIVRQVLPNQTIPHPSYAPDLSPYDIALIKIDPPFEFNANVKKVDLPTDGPKPSDEVTVFGWGKINHEPMPNILQTVDTKVIDNAKCDSQHTIPINPQQICTQLDISENAIGSGDSGGPLVQYAEGGKTVLVGIVSIGKVDTITESPVTKFPSIFARTWAFIDWINETSKRLMNST